MCSVLSKANYEIKKFDLKSSQHFTGAKFFGKVFPFLSRGILKCGLAHSSFISREIKFSTVSQGPTTTEVQIVIQNIPHLVSSRRTAVGGRGFKPQTGQTLRVLRSLRKMSCLCYDIRKRLDFLVFSDKYDNLWGQSSASLLYSG